MVNSLMSVASVLNTIFGVVLAIIILLAMITIHEFGHYLAGKLLKFKINEFAIGFGPALFKRKRKNSDEIFSIRLLPLGGYCAFEGEDGLEDDSKDKTEENAPMPEKEPFEEVAEATVFTEEAANTSSPPPMDLPPREGAEAARSSQPSGSVSDGAFTKKKPWQRIIVLVAGATMNYLLALLLIFVCFLSYGQTMVAVYETEKTEIAAEYCLQDFDILLEANGRRLYLSTDLAAALNGKKKGELVKMKVSRAIGFEWKIDSETGEKKGTYDHREVTTVEVQLRDDITVKNSTDLDGVYRALGFLGTHTTQKDGSENISYSIASGTVRYGFFETIWRSIVYSFKIAGSIFRVLGELLTFKLSLSAFGGPVTTIKITSQVAGMSFRHFLEISAYIGVNLAVFNLLPIPALDGSKVVFTTIEWIFKKPVNRKVEAIIHTVGFVLLLGFAILVDILQFVL